MAAVLLRPGHADPAFLPHLAGEFGIHPGPGFGFLHRLALGQFGAQEVADFEAQGLGFGGGWGWGEGEGVHRLGPRGWVTSG